LPGPYKLDAYQARGHFRLTNKTPAATYRSPGRYEANFVRERLMDVVAARLGISTVDVRRRNLIAASDMPYDRPLRVLGDDVSYDSGDYIGLLDKTLDHLQWGALNAELSERRARGELVGAGFGMFVEKSGLGPTDGVRVNVDTRGGVEVITGGASVGQGFETVIAQVCADALGVDYARIRVVHGRTDRIEYGLGAHASRATVMTANATAIAAANVRAKALDMASELLQLPIDQLDIVDGTILTKTMAEAGPSISLAKIAEHLRPASATRGARTPGLCADGWFNTSHQTFPYGVHVAVARVDAATASVTIERYLIAFDVGRAINPTLVRGQIAGGFVQGLGGALFEEFRYSENGDPLAVTFADYLIPTAREVPPLEIIVTEDAPSPRNPLGVKGAGEAGIAAVGAAVAAAVDDALGIPGAIRELPITPGRLKTILEASDDSARSLAELNSPA
jgi:carbon-monoxide dehydrogenase large subunit/6-hydroxypseudooxynicotine dehydrogenase subunit gamma